MGNFDEQLWGISASGVNVGCTNVTADRYGYNDYDYGHGYEYAEEYTCPEDYEVVELRFDASAALGFLRKFHCTADLLQMATWRVIGAFDSHFSPALYQIQAARLRHIEIGRPLEEWPSVNRSLEFGPNDFGRVAEVTPATLATLVKAHSNWMLGHVDTPEPITP